MKIQRGDCIRTFIKVATIRQKELAIKFYEKRGFKLAPYQRWRISNKGSYYVFPNIEQNWIVLTSSSAAIERLKEIDLFRRNRPRLPRRMLVSENAIDWQERLVRAVIKNLDTKEDRYITAYWPSEDEKPIQGDELFLLRSWRYVKEIK